jgi:trimeric autotransporter adhesin
VDSAGGVVAVGQLGIGIIPASGCGYRMMWHPYRASFRAGGTDDGGTCNSWDEVNQGFYSWAGGNLTKATQFASFAFGDQAEATNQLAVAFGSSVSVSGVAGFSAGASNKFSGFACVAIGFTTTATGQGSVALGFRTTADADYSVAIGHRASVNGKSGSFVIADQSTTDSLEAQANNSFSARYAGGYRLFTNATETTGMFMNAGGSSWNVVSDRNRKEDFSELDGETVLLRLRSVPVTKWRYKGEADRTVRHIGPMAQDWHAAFGLSSDNESINQGDFDGVNLAAVKALDGRTERMQQLLIEKDRRIDDLEARLRRLEELLKKHEH